MKTRLSILMILALLSTSKPRLLATLVLLSLLLLAATAAGGGSIGSLQGAAIAQPAAPSQIYLPRVASRVISPSSFDLIEKARQAGKISDETAILYRVYAAFGDPLLPSEYAGAWSEDSLEADVAIRDALAAWYQLSPQSQRALGPFFQPPIYVGSWFDRLHFPQPAAAAPDGAPLSLADEPGPTFLVRDGWHSVISNYNAVKVWWHESGDPLQAQVASAIASIADEVWMAETRLMQRVPLRDDGEHRFKDDEGVEQVWGDGGDERFDIYMADCLRCGGAMAVGYPPACTQTPSFVLIKPDYAMTRTWIGGDSVKVPDTKNIQHAVPHELMHALQFSYKYAEPCSKYLGIDEAGAVWAEDFVYPDNQSEHLHEWRFRDSHETLFGYSSSGYEDWVFPFYLTHTYTPTLIRTWWEQTEKAGPLKALDTALQALESQPKLQDVYHDFALNLWNRPPVDFYQEHDQVTLVGWGHPLHEYVPNEKPVDHTQMVDLGGKQHVEYTLPVRLDSLSTKYFHFVFIDDTARSVSFYNPFPNSVWPHAEVKVQALVNVQGAWLPVDDWTDKEEIFFCRQLPGERIEELVVIVSNGQWADPTLVVQQPSLPMMLQTSNIGCKGWQGTVTTVHEMSVPGVWRKETLSASSVRFEREEPDSSGWWSQYYEVQPTNIHWEYEGIVADCRVEATPLDLVGQEGDGGLAITHTSDAFPDDIGQLAGGAIILYETELRYVCPGFTSVDPYFIQDWMGIQSLRVSADGMSIVGSASGGDSSWTHTSVVNFTAIP